MPGKRKAANQSKPTKPFASAKISTRPDGWKQLTVESEQLAVSVLPEYGGWILSAVYKPRNVELLWQCPRGVPAKDDPPVVTDPLQAYRARSPGGWPELFPHGSAPAEALGAKLPFHGEVVNRAWRAEVLKSRGPEAVARMAVDCQLLPLRLERVLRVAAGGATFVLEETATNYSGLPVDFMWGHHPIYGQPLLDAGARIFAPAARSLTGDYRPAGWPVHEGRDLSVCPGEGAGTGEMFYAEGLSAGWYALVNAKLRLGVALSWDPEVFPLLWIWREANSSKGYPYFGGAYALAIEPFSSLPGARERGERLLHLDGGKSMSTRLAFTAFEGLVEVTGVSPDGEVSGR